MFIIICSSQSQCLWIRSWQRKTSNLKHSFGIYASNVKYQQNDDQTSLLTVFPFLRLALLICWDSPHWVIIGPIGAVDSGHWDSSAPHSAEVMCLTWRCPTAPGEQWLGAGITSGLLDPGLSCQDKQPRYWKSREGGSNGCFFAVVTESLTFMLKSWRQMAWQLYMAPYAATQALEACDYCGEVFKKRQRDRANQHERSRSLWEHMAAFCLD